MKHTDQCRDQFCQGCEELSFTPDSEVIHALHDPLCPVSSHPDWQECVHCELIERVREDERASALMDAVRALQDLGT